MQLIDDDFYDEDFDECSEKSEHEELRESDYASRYREWQSDNRSAY